MHLIRDELRELPLFAEASRSQLAVIRRQLTMLHVPAGKVLVHEDARGDEFMILAEGEAEVTQGGHHVATLGRGDLVGEMALLQEHGRGRRNATVTALTDLVLYAGSPSEFRRILESAPSVAEKVRQTVAARAMPRAA
jgi:CRP/FNR family transcriptional regulator, cyclic AMP receptor protein